MFTFMELNIVKVSLLIKNNFAKGSMLLKEICRGISFIKKNCGRDFVYWIKFCQGCFILYSIIKNSGLPKFKKKQIFTSDNVKIIFSCVNVNKNSS